MFIKTISKLIKFQFDEIDIWIHKLAVTSILYTQI